MVVGFTMGIRYILLIAFAAILFSGCSVKNNFDVHLPKTTYPLDYKLANVNVQIANNQQKTGDIDVFDASFTENFQSSLLKALAETSMFDVNSNNIVSIKAMVLKKDTPMAGFTITIVVEVMYEIKNTHGNVLYHNIIHSKGVATVGDEFVGVKRGALANDRAIQNNIKLFIQDLENKKGKL